MYFILRIIRALAGVVAAFEVIGLGKNFNTLVLSESANEETIGLFIAKVIITVITISIFVGIRKFINYSHTKKHNRCHPSLENPWAL